MSADPSGETGETGIRPCRIRERELVLAARAGRSEARSALVETYLPLIGSVARLYRGSPSVERAELLQEGVVGLLRALERYDPELGTPFWAYASWWVRQAMQQLVAELTRPVVLSDRALRQLAHVREARRAHSRRHWREPSLTELADASDLSLSQLQSLLAAERDPRGLDEPAGGPGASGATVGEMLADPRAEDDYDRLALRLDGARLPELLETALNERERTVVQGRFGLGCPEVTLRELGARLGVSAERVRQIEQSAIEKLRTAVGDHVTTTTRRADRPTTRRAGCGATA